MLSNGELPLGVQAEVVDGWVATQRADLAGRTL
jgi:hypothetical protein